MERVLDAPESLHRFSVAEFTRMMEAGFFGDEDRVELLDGVIVDMAPENPPHALVSARLARFFILGLAENPALLVKVGSALALRPRSLPMPDVAVYDAADVTWRAHPQQAHLVVEVSDTSLRKDGTQKARIYAAAGVPEYWIVDLVKLHVHVHRDPREDSYDSIRTMHPPDELQALRLPLPPLPLAALLATN